MLFSARTEALSRDRRSISVEQAVNHRDPNLNGVARQRSIATPCQQAQGVIGGSFNGGGGRRTLALESGMHRRRASGHPYSSQIRSYVVESRFAVPSSRATY